MGNVVLTGGGSLFNGFADRLETELSARQYGVLHEMRSELILTSKVEDTCARKPHRKTIWWMAKGHHPGESRHFPPAVDNK